MSHRLNTRAWLRGKLCAALLASSTLMALTAGLLASGTAQASTLPTLTLALTKSSITVGGTTQSGAVNVVSSDSGVKEGLTILFAIKPGYTVAEVEAALKAGAGKDPNRADKYGAIVFDAEVNPGQTNEAQTVLTPGQYVALGGAGEGGPKLKAPFTVTAAAAPATLPTAEATVRSIEFGFRGPTTLHDGELVRFENEGFLVHMDVAFPAKSLKAAKAIVKGMLTGKEKGLEKLVSGAPFAFAGPLSHEGFQQETITAKPGWYVQACFMDTQDGRSHTLLGMERIFKIVK
ncbi:MAG: hypothetical protein ABR992_04785 [Solirubrobacteraceae bacterium]